MPPKARGKRDRADRGVKPISGLDVAALLAQDPSRKKLDPANAVPHFKQMIEVSETMSQVEDASKQMGSVIRDLITDSLGNNGYDQAMEDLGVFRAQMIDMEEPDFYNTFIADLKMRLLSGELGGDRRELWWQMKGAKLGLIDETQSEQSKVTMQKAIDVSLISSFDVQIPATNQVSIVLQEMRKWRKEVCDHKSCLPCHLRHMYKFVWTKCMEEIQPHVVSK